MMCHSDHVPAQTIFPSNLEDSSFRLRLSGITLGKGVKGRVAAHGLLYLQF